MKRLTMILTVLAVAGLMSAAVAGDKPTAKAHAASTAESPEMGACCVKAAKAGEACCGKPAAAVKAKYTAVRAHEMVKQEMHACCAAAVVEGKGCCGLDAAGLKTKYGEKVHEATAKIVTLDGMHPCCAAAVVDDKGCCGKAPADLKASFEKQVEKNKSVKVAGDK